MPTGNAPGRRANGRGVASGRAWRPGALGGDPEAGQTSGCNAGSAWRGWRSPGPGSKCPGSTTSTCWSRRSTCWSLGSGLCSVSSRAAGAGPGAASSRTQGLQGGGGGAGRRPLGNRARAGSLLGCGHAGGGLGAERGLSVVGGRGTGTLEIRGRL